MRRAIKSATKAERSYQDSARELGCVVCRHLGVVQVGNTEIHHRNGGDQHGQKQIGQHAVVAMCEYHHRGIPLWGFGDAEMRALYGPSYALHAKDFRVWTDDVLPHLAGRGTERWQEYQDELIQPLA